MTRSILALALVFLCGACCIPASFAANKVSFKGVTPGISTLDDTSRILGKPVSKIIDGDQTIYKYRFGSINFPKKTGKIEHIFIYDQSVKDVNGFRVGSKYSDVKEKLNVNDTGGALFDQGNGILYVFDQEGLVSRIIYGVVAP